MTSLLVLILVIAAVGCVVGFATSLGLPKVFVNLIYLVVALAVIYFLIHVVQTGHLPRFQ